MKFLLEIGVEEVPDWMLPSAIEHLRTKIAELLGPKIALAEATPRRLAVVIDRIAEREKDRTEIVKGPPVAAPVQAVEGFARKHGVTAADLKPDGSYYHLTKNIPGRATKEILTKELPGIILGIPWPKTMLWPGKGGERFIRPIRWMVCLLGKEIVSIEINGVVAGDKTFGHRQIGPKLRDGSPKPIKVSISTYEKALEKAGVILRATKRREKILGEVGPDAAKAPALVDAHTYLNEWPTALRGSFSGDYLSLPEEVLETVMRHHQKYFAVRGDDGKLQPEFIAVMNRKDDPEGLIRAGNERVLRARFNDARFFYEVDQKRTLDERVEDLKAVTFHKDIGSYYEKMERMVAMCSAPEEIRAARLCKADLTTEMVKEFPELQGIVGGLYAEAQGESPEVAKAIYEHYRPLSMDDAIPSTELGQRIALVDKLDTLRQMFEIGQIPSGSRDPFALRRASQGLVRLRTEGVVRLMIEGAESMETLPGTDYVFLKFHHPDWPAFIRERIVHYLRDVKGYKYDEVNAVLAAGLSNLKDVSARLSAVASVRTTPNFEPLAAAFKRIKNILKQAGAVTESDGVNPVLLETGHEAQLHSEFLRVKSQLSGDYATQLATIATLRPAVDAFFDKVMVNVEDTAVRRNRLSLLATMLREFSKIADFSEIVTG